MKKYLIRAAVFLLLFALCFSGAQSILHYRWSGNENLYTRIYAIPRLPRIPSTFCAWAPASSMPPMTPSSPTRKQALPATILPSPSAAP